MKNITITWDGNTEGKDIATVSVMDETFAQLCKVSDIILTEEDMYRVKITVYANDKYSSYVNKGGEIVDGLFFTGDMELFALSGKAGDYETYYGEEGVPMTLHLPSDGTYFAFREIDDDTQRIAAITNDKIYGVAKCGGLRYDTLALKEIDGIITSAEKDFVDSYFIASACGGLKFDADNFKEKIFDDKTIIGINFPQEEDIEGYVTANCSLLFEKGINKGGFEIGEAGELMLHN